MVELLRDIRVRQGLRARALACLDYLENRWSKAPQFAEPSAALVRAVRKKLRGRLEKRTCRSVAQALRAECELRERGCPDGFATLVSQLELELALHPAELAAYVQTFAESLTRDQLELLAYKSRSPDSSGLDAVRQLFNLAAPTASSGKWLTRSQSKVLTRMVEVGAAFYACPQTALAKRRMSLLMCGPTGAGKTFLAVEAAARLDAEPVVTTVGDWIPCGASQEFEPTPYAILSAICRSPRVVLVIDELDKISTTIDGTWTRSVWAEIWRVLDFSLPVAGFLKSSGGRAIPVEEKDLAARVRELWIVGCGTWQDQHQRAPLGFEASDRKRMVDCGIGVPAELLLRFHPQLLRLEYPSPEETVEIFASSGLTRAAADVGLQLDPLNHDWSRGGVRTIQALWAEVEVLKRRNHESAGR